MVTLFSILKALGLLLAGVQTCWRADELMSRWRGTRTTSLPRREPKKCVGVPVGGEVRSRKVDEPVHSYQNNGNTQNTMQGRSPGRVAQHYMTSVFITYYRELCSGSRCIRGNKGGIVIRKGVKDMVKCPYCGYEGEFRLLKTWRYRWWDVYFYQCPRCSGKFRYQVDPEGKRKSYVMRVGRKDAGGS